MAKELKALEQLAAELAAQPKSWFLTGAAGFIGSHLLEFLLSCDQRVVAIDNFATGKRENLEEVERVVGTAAWQRCSFHEVDICDFDKVQELLQGADVVLHQAALGSVPRSVKDPLATNHANVTGFLTVAHAAVQSGVSRFVYASSSSVYGDDPQLPKMEDRMGSPLSPYAASKAANEIYAAALSRLYSTSFVGLRYFNVFGPRQDPNGPYAAVIPRWMQTLLDGQQCEMFGDGETSRDFCYVKNAVQANVRAALSSKLTGGSRVMNVAVGQRTTLNQLLEKLVEQISEGGGPAVQGEAISKPFREGDVPHSLADVSRACEEIDYVPEWTIDQGLRETVAWYVSGADTSGLNGDLS